MISRRGVAKLLGLTPAALPLATKAAVDAEIGGLSGVSSRGAASIAYDSPNGFPSTSGTDYDKARLAAADYVKLMGVPDFARETMRRSAGYVGVLDADIAAHRSWSMSVKILTQRERNLDRQIESIAHTAWKSRRQSAFKALTGWEWPW